ncbi:MAG: arylamine N-acetyltransferase [Pseudomonadales bacterium]|jgi:N-hydroxyarylamine O-acetyltransferase|nr:arylamine N-acetyltransferase [Pseudomonadales bacterium]
MLLTLAQLEQYFQRIGYTGPRSATLETLCALHRLHPLAIPFENLDPWLGQPPTLDGAVLFDKLVLRQRGGYCLEQNGLFAQVLQTLGFTVRGLSARVFWNLDADAQPPRTHQALLVAVAGAEWLVDVGFGGLTLLGPLRLAPDCAQSTPLETLRLRQSGTGFMLDALLPSGAKPMYHFVLETALPADFIQSNWYVGAYPQSRFVRHLITACVRLEANHTLTRHNLFDRAYSIYRSGQAPEIHTLQNAAQLRQLLREVFALPIDALPSLAARVQTLFSEQ